MSTLTGSVRRLGGAVLFMLFALPALAFAQAADKKSSEDEFFKFDNTPKLDGSSAEPISFRYKLKEGQVLKVNMGSSLDMVIRQGAMKMEMKQDMTIAAKAAVTAVDSEGNISVVVKITRFQMKLSGMAEAEFDSDKPDDANDNFKPLLAMINVGIPCKISPVGKLLETDLEPMRLAVRRAGNAAMEKMLEDSTEKMFEGTFTELSEAPVKAGETYKAGTIVQDKIKMHVSYKINAVSGNKGMAIMEPQGKMEAAADAFPGAQVEIKKNRMGGWIQFDLNKGYAKDGEVRFLVTMDISADGEKGTAEMRLKSTVKSTLE